MKSENTKPEKQLRSLLHRAGYRFTINARNNKKLPGRPDIVLAKHKTVIFMHGCFWHRHKGCKKTRTPKTNVDFWESKFANNKKRDHSNCLRLKALGWNIIIIWECQLKDPSAVMRRVRDNLFAEDDLSDIEKAELRAAEKIAPYDF